MKKSIIFVILSLQSGGAEKSLVNLLNEMNPNAYDIDLLLFRKKGVFLSQIPDYVNVLNTPPIVEALYNQEKSKGILEFCVRAYKAFATGFSSLFEKDKPARGAFRWKFFYRKVIPSLKKEYEAAVAYLEGEPTYFCMDKIPDAKKKIVWVHNDYKSSGFPKKYDESYFTRADKIVSVSNECVEILRQEFPLLRDKIIGLNNINSSTVIRRRASEYVPEDLNFSVPIILSIGRLMNQKGFDMAVDAATILKDRGYLFHWYVVGEGELRTSLEKQISKLSMEEYFILLGLRENPYVYLNNCNVFVQSSRYEGKSVVLDEAKILSKPIVVTNYDTVEDQICSGKEGIIVEMTPEGIAEGIMGFLDNPDLEIKIIDYLRNHEYGNQTEIKKYEQIF